MFFRRAGMRCLAAAAVLAAGAATATGAEAVDLAARYVDPINGFSLRPPAGAERSRETSPSRLVRWSVRDAKTGAIAWTLTVRKESSPDPGVTLKSYAEALEKSLTRRPETRVESVMPAKLLGKDAIYVRTEQGAKARRWQYELWVLADAKRFLVVSVNGPLGLKDLLESVGRTVTATLKLTDPKTLAEARKVNLKRGLDLLQGVTNEKLAAAVSGEPRWYLYRKAGRDIGFMHVAEQMGRPGLAKGLEVRTFAQLELAGGQVMHLRREMFATADRATEKWSEQVRIFQGGKVVRTMSESGSASAGTIVCEVTSAGKSDKRAKALSGATAAHYLPRAMAGLLPRLVDRSEAGAWAFAGYTTSANDFDMRTFTIVGPEQVTVGAQTHQAVRAEDQVAADAGAATLHVDDKGALLRMRTDVGITMELSTRSAITRRFANAEALVRSR